MANPLAKKLALQVRELEAALTAKRPTYRVRIIGEDEEPTPGAIVLAFGGEG